jgi:chromosome segregation ATPase
MDHIKNFIKRIVAIITNTNYAVKYHTLKIKHESSLNKWSVRLLKKDDKIENLEDRIKHLENKLKELKLKIEEDDKNECNS